MIAVYIIFIIVSSSLFLELQYPTDGEVKAREGPTSRLSVSKVNLTVDSAVSLYESSHLLCYHYQFHKIISASSTRFLSQFGIYQHPLSASLTPFGDILDLFHYSYLLSELCLFFASVPLWDFPKSLFTPIRESEREDCSYPCHLTMELLILFS